MLIFYYSKLKSQSKVRPTKNGMSFFLNPDSKRALYQTTVSSIFEHFPYVWRPSSTTMNKHESIQKKLNLKETF